MIAPSEYSDFVRSHFKTFGPAFERGGVLNGLALTLHHATTGMCGEASELATAEDREDFIKECGDFEFYLEALVQNFDCAKIDYLPALDKGIGGLINQLQVVSADMLDLTKKLWVYEEPPEKRVLMLSAHAATARHILSHIYQIIGTDRPMVQAINVEKLKARYPNGYTNEAAQARADATSERHDG